MKFRIIFLGIFLLTAGSIVSADYDKARIETNADKKEVFVGEPIKLTVTVRVAGSAMVDFPDQPGDFSPFEILNTRLEREDGEISEYQMLYELAVYDTGYAKIPSAPVTVSGYKDNKPVTDTLFTKAIPIFCKISKPDTLKSIHPNEDLISPSLPWKTLIPILIVILALLWLLWRWYIKRKAEKMGATGEYAPPPEPADVIALRRLNELKKSDWLDRGEYKKWYSELSDIFREYLENRFDNINAMEMTTSELIPALREIMREDETRTVQKFLSLADMVKFAKYSPEKEAHLTHLNFVEEWIKANGPKPEPIQDVANEDVIKAENGEEKADE